MSNQISIQPFIQLLRKSGLEISIDSAILGQQIIDLGYFSATEKKLRQALQSVIIKRREEFDIFNICFDIYFLSNSNNSLSKTEVLSMKDDLQDKEFSKDGNKDQNILQNTDNNPNQYLEQFGDHRSDVALELQLSGSPGGIGGDQFDDKRRNEAITLYTRWLPSELQSLATKFLMEPNKNWDTLLNEFIEIIFGFGQYKHVQTIAQRYTRYSSYLTRGYSQLLDQVNQDENLNLRIQNIQELEFLRQKIIDFLRQVRLRLLKNPELDSSELLKHFYALSYLPQVKDYLQQDFQRIEGDMEKVQQHLLYLGKKIAIQEKRKRLRAHYGKINFRRTIRNNISNGGHILTISHQKKKLLDPKIVLLSDVSGSTSWVSEFFFIITYAAQSTFKKLSLFEFDNTTCEITRGLKSPTLSQALQKRVESWQNPPRTRQIHSNYNTSFIDFSILAEKYFSHTTTILILGDCRDWMGGYIQTSKGDYEPESKNVLKKIIKRNRRVIILNPESPERWNTGDSIVDHFKDAGAEIYYVENILTLMNFIFKNNWNK